ncbi:MAG: PQQ-binding-like beta-propeller repeat protein [Pirellulales bacterium]|nr:PQQ-binding-like beta-propeller repeat protein [Pirellulales bacterium]
MTFAMPRAIRVALLLSILAVGVSARAVLAAAPSSSDWPQFRGPHATGAVEAGTLPLKWSATENVRWKQAIPGRGWASPIVWGDRVFLTTVESDGDGEKQRRGLYLGGERPEISPAVHRWKVMCLDLADGTLLWEKTAHEGPPPSSIHLKNTYASETPVTDGELLYVYFGNVGVFAYDFEGNRVWSKNLGNYPSANGWGTGASPTLTDDALIVLNDNEESSFITALDKQTGAEKWRVARDRGSNWATPFVWRTPERTELIASGAGQVLSYDLDGNVLWQLNEMSRNAIPTPFAHHGLLYVTSGHVMGNKKPLVAVKPGAKGDITPVAGADTSEFVAWRQKAAAPYNPSPLAYGDYIYVVLDAGIIACYDANTGEIAYGKRRIPDGKAYTASPWAYRDAIFCLNEFGVTTVVKAGPEFEVLHTNPLDEEAMCLATPAIAGNKLLIRTDSQLYCIEE